MRGEIDAQPQMFSYVDLEVRIPPQHLIRKIRGIVDEALLELEPAFDQMYLGPAIDTIGTAVVRDVVTNIITE